MYVVDDADEVVELSAPQSNVGAPLPLVLADEGTLLLAYLLQEHDPDWDGTYVTIVGMHHAGRVAIVEFDRHRAFVFGPPNDEAFEGHPLASRGLEPYGAFEIRRSSWIRALERMNRVHEHHDPATFESLRHFVFAFHDSTFECVARGFDIRLAAGSLSDALRTMETRLLNSASG